MAIIKFFRKLGGLVKGGNIISAPLSKDNSMVEAKRPGDKLPESDIVRKKKDWRFSKDEY